MTLAPRMWIRSGAARAGAVTLCCAAGLLLVAGCGGGGPSAGGGPNGPGGKTYALGDRIAAGEQLGTYCGTIGSTGTRDFPNVRHFAIAKSSDPLAEGNCSSLTQFFTDLVGSKAGVVVPANSTYMFEGQNVTKLDARAGELGGYSVHYIGGYKSRFGKLTGFAAGF